MKKLFSSKVAKRHFMICAATLVVLLAILLVNAVTKSNSLPKEPATTTLAKTTTLRTRINDENVDVKVRKGSTVKVLGAIDGAFSTAPFRLWVELEDGTRGDIQCHNFDVELMAYDSDEDELIPVTVKSITDHEYICIFPDGSEDEVEFDDLRPQWPEEWDVKYLNSTYTNYYMTVDKFQEKYIGSTYEENEKRYRPARYVATQKGITYASYPLWVIDTDTGLRHKPTVVYGKDGIAQSFANCSTEDRAQFFVRIFPFLGTFADTWLGAKLIEGSMFTSSEPETDAPLLLKILLFILLVIYVILILLWLYATPMIPVLIMGILLHFPKVFYHLGNKTLNTIISVIALVSTYIWTGLLLAWGIPWLCLLPMLFIPLFITSFVTAPLHTSAPHSRCLTCRKIESMEFVDSVYHHEYEKWMRKTEYVKQISEKQRKWKTWTDVTRKYSDGHTTHSQENVQYHTETIRTALYDDYKVLYNVKVYQNNYACSICGQKEHTFSEEYTEIDREYMGTHTETTVE